MAIETQAKQCTCSHSGVFTSPHSREVSSVRAAAHRLLDKTHFLRRALRFFVSPVNDPTGQLDIVALSRVRDRVNTIARLLGEMAKELKRFGVDKRSPFITDSEGRKSSLQDASRAIHAIQKDLMKAKAGDAFSSIANSLEALRGIAETVGTGAVRPSNIPPQGNQPPSVIDLTKDNSSIWEGLGNFFTFNGTEDDNARKFVSEQSCDGIRGLIDDDLAKLINAMLDGPTGDDDERGILKILDCLDCKRCGVIVGRVGLRNLLSDIDGEEWDRLILRLLKCEIIGFDKMDDDTSRQFVNSHGCSQLGALNMDGVRQLVLNMFAGSCGDDDEDAILKLLSCQSTSRLQQLVSMPGTGVTAFDYNFDGSQWYDLELLFAAHGIRLDP